MNLSMALYNYGNPLVTRSMAEEIALVVVRHRIPQVYFRAEDVFEVRETADTWLVSFKNQLVPTPEMPFVSPMVVIEVRKADAAIMAITGPR